MKCAQDIYKENRFYFRNAGQSGINRQAADKIDITVLKKRVNQKIEEDPQFCAEIEKLLRK